MIRRIITRLSATAFVFVGRAGFAPVALILLIRFTIRPNSGLDRVSHV
jgi:hypothetical protein